MRFQSVLAGALTLLLFCLLPCEQAQAQSFLQTLFGFGSPPRAKSPPSAAHLRRTLRSPRVIDLRSLPYNRQNDPANYGSGSWSNTGSYRTVCVRACDGFYFPINSNARRANFHRDARVCEQRCGSKAKLYYMPRTGGDISRAYDLAGREYADLPNAFKYRKALKNGCSCRPMPWSPTERARHSRYRYVAAVEASYALAEARAKKRREDQDRKARQRIVEGQAGKDNFAQSVKAALEIAADHLGNATEPTVAASNKRSGHSGADHDRWLMVSVRFAAPYYAHGREPKMPAPVASFDVDDTSQIIGTDTELPMVRLLTHSQQARKLRRRHRTRKKIAARKRRTKTKKKSGLAVTGLFGTNKSKYRWPGD